MGIVHLFWVSSFIILQFEIFNCIVFLVAYFGQKEVVKELLNHNADIESKNTKGKSPLISGIRLYYCCWIL